jgi:adhesin transport system outer membrane protein
MRGIFRILVVTTALSVPSFAHAATLSDSVMQAQAQHPRIEAGKAGREAATRGVQEQKSGYFPRVGISGRAGYVDQDDDTTRGITGGSASTTLIEGSVTLTQPIFSGFTTVNRVAAAKNRVKAAEHDINANAEDVSLSASRAHLNLMRTRELLDMASNYLTEIQSRKDKIEMMLKEGAADEAEFLQADEILMAAKTTRLGYEEAYRQAEAEYIEAVGALPQSLELGDALWDGKIPATVDEAIAAAQAQNPRIISAENVMKALGAEAQAEKGELSPKVDAELSYLDKNQENDVGGDLTSAQAMLKLSWNFETGGGQMARIGKSLAQQSEARARRAEALRAVEYAVRQKYTAMQIVDQQFGLYTEREKANVRILDNYLQQFEGGQQSNLQLISAHSRLFEARAAKIDAYYRQFLSRFELLNAMGHLRTALSPVAQTASK